MPAQRQSWRWRELLTQKMTRDKENTASKKDGQPKSSVSVNGLAFE